MKIIKLVLILVCLVFVYFLYAKDYFEFQNSYKDVSAQKAYRIIERYQDLIVIDISGTYEMGHIPGSINYFIGDGSLDEALKEFDKNELYLIYYHTNKTSVLAAKKFTKAGFKRVYRLDGNFSSWVEAGFETTAIRI